jgi:hypothetical protein
VVTPPPPEPTPFPAAAQRVVLGTSTFPVDFDAGWIYANLNTFVIVSPNPPSNPSADQGWIVTVFDDPDVGAYGTRGRIRTAMPAVQLYNAGQP